MKIDLKNSYKSTMRSLIILNKILKISMYLWKITCDCSNSALFNLMPSMSAAILWKHRKTYGKKIAFKWLKADILEVLSNIKSFLNSKQWYTKLWPVQNRSENNLIWYFQFCLKIWENNSTMVQGMNSMLDC